MGKKTRVYELARELGRNSKEILDLLAESGVRDKNHMSALEDNVVRFIENRFAEKEGRKEPKRPAGGRAAQPDTERETPAAKEAAPPREKPKPKPRPKPLPLPRPTQPRRPGQRYGAGRPRPAVRDMGAARSASPPAPGQRRGPGSRRASNGRPAADGYPAARDSRERRWTPAGATPAGQRPGARKHWPTQIAPTMPPARPRTQARTGRPAPGSTGAVAGMPAGAAEGRGRAFERSRQIRPVVPPAPQKPAEPEVQGAPGMPIEGATATPRPERVAPRETPEVVTRAPEKAPETIPVTATAAPGTSARPGQEGAEPSVRATRPEEARSREADGHRRAQQPPKAPAAQRPATRQATPRQPVAGRPAGGAAAGARPRPPRPDRAPDARRPSAEGPRPEARRDGRGQRDHRPERRLELIKGGKGAEKLREARAEAIIRARKPRRGAGAQPGAAAARKREHPRKEKKVALPASITVGELAEKLGVGSGEVIKSLMSMGVLATINQEIDFDAASLVADEHGFDVEPLEQKEAREFGIEDVPDAPEALRTRPPVVTVLGHVDHGKTSLLDAIRQTNVTAQEAGGITQHIGAYQVELGGRRITFIDTPGHEAFTAMRARGAQVTDIAVLVVAADDGVMPQTIEAINHARAAKVPIVVAVNKIDKVNAQPDRVKQELAQQGLVPEEWGGDTVTVEISALRKQGIEELLEMILLVADMRDIKANPDRPAKGTVVEARLDRGRGPVATVLVEKGTLRVGDAIVAGEVFGKVRAMTDDQGRAVEAAGPSTPVEVLGFSEVPQAGDVIHVASEDKLAKQLAARRSDRKRAEEIQGARTMSLDALFGKIQEGDVKELNLIIKADVQGSVEALRQSLEHLSTDEVKVNVIHSGVGAITESDVMLASASGAIIIGFQVRPDVNAKKMAERDHVDVRLYRIIYDATADVKAAMEGLLEPEKHEVTLGRADVMATFHVPKVGVVAGCKVSDGRITRDALVRVLRDNVVVHEGKIESLRRFKDDVPEVASGYECGIGLVNFQDIKEGDVIEAFKVEETRRAL